MSENNRPDNEFQSTVEMLVSEIEDCIRVLATGKGREFDFQHQAFKERCEQAINLAGRIKSDGQRTWSLRSGDAYRIQQSLRSSLAYFRGQLDG